MIRAACGPIFRPAPSPSSSRTSRVRRGCCTSSAPRGTRGARRAPRVIRQACAAEGGVEVDTQGDAFFFAFPTAPGAPPRPRLHRALAEGPIQVRVGLHTGAPSSRARATSETTSTSPRESPLGPWRPGDPLGNCGLSPRAHRPRRAPAQGHRAGPHLPARRRDLPPLKTISNTNLPPPASLPGPGGRARAEPFCRRRASSRSPDREARARPASRSRSLDQRFSDYKAGVFWVGLASLRDPPSSTDDRADPRRRRAGPDALEASRHLQGKMLLLLLDNLEQVIAAPPSSPSSRGLPQPHAPRHQSRALRIQGEQLRRPSAASSRGRRPLLRTRSAEPSPEIAELCARLDSLPLAVELAAARTEPHPRPDPRASLAAPRPAQGRPRRRPRQHTLRATIEWSYELLSPESRSSSPAFPSSPAAARSRPPKRSVTPTSTPAVARREEPPSLHGRALLDARDDPGVCRGATIATSRAATVQAHARHFLELAESSESALWEQHTEVWLPRLDREESNLRAALGWTLAEDAEWALRMSGALYPYWEIRARQKEARFGSSAAGLGGVLALELRAKDLISAGRVAGWDSDWSAATALLDEAVDLCGQLGWQG